MQIWNVPGVEDEPKLTLCSWRVVEFEYDSKTLRAVHGYCIERSEARTTSPIEKINIAAMSVTTWTGRTYQLSGPLDYDNVALQMWQELANMRGIKAFKDVSAEVYAEHLKATE